MMIDKRLQEYRKYQRFLQIMLILTGCWYMPAKSGKPMYCWSVCTFLMMIMYLIINFHTAYIYRNDLLNMMKFIGISTAAISAIIKVGTFMINRCSLINYHQTMNDLFEEELAQNEKIRMIILSPLRSMSILAYTYFAFMTSLVLVYFAPVYILLIRQLLHFHLTTNYTLPLTRGYGYFWTVPHNFLYHFHLFLETTLVAFSSMTAATVDNVFGFYVYQFASTMRAMIFRLTSPLYSDNKKFPDLLRTCVAKHQKLLRCRNVLEHIYGPIIFWHIITNAVLLCALIYEAIGLEFNFRNVLAFLTYGGVKLLQTFIYTWYGTVLTSTGEDFRNGIYFSEWSKSGFDHHIKANIILIMLQKPMTVNAFYFPVDVVLFTNFVNTSMSYFFVLRSIGNKGG